MAHSFFSKQPRSPLLPTPSTTSRPKSNANAPNNANPGGAFTSFFQQSLLNPPPSTSPSTPPPTSSAYNPAAQLRPAPYPDALNPLPTPHPHVTIDPIRTAHVQSLTRITGLLLPVRYPNSFFTQSITDPLVASVSRVAVYHDHPVSAAMIGTETARSASSSDKVIGAIRCRLEPIPPVSLERGPQSGRGRHNLYIQALHLLSPYRGSGIAVALLEGLIYGTLPEGKRAETTSTSTSTSSSAARRVPSSIARHYNIRTVTAHVHEANDEALHWYESRGFEVLPGTVEGYYRRLKPGGARVVQLKLNWADESNDHESQVSQPKAARNDRDGKRITEKRTAEEDDEDWEKVEADECNAVEKLEDYCTVGDFDVEESARKKIRSH